MTQQLPEGYEALREIRQRYFRTGFTLADLLDPDGLDLGEHTVRRELISLGYELSEWGDYTPYEDLPLYYFDSKDFWGRVEENSNARRTSAYDSLAILQGFEKADDAIDALATSTELPEVTLKITEINANTLREGGDKGLGFCDSGVDDALRELGFDEQADDGAKMIGVEELFDAAYATEDFWEEYEGNLADLASFVGYPSLRAARRLAAARASASGEVTLPAS